MGGLSADSAIPSALSLRRDDRYRRMHLEVLREPHRLAGVIHAWAQNLSEETILNVESSSRNGSSWQRNTYLSGWASLRRNGWLQK